MTDSQDFELLSDATNAVIARHVGRNYPGVLIQGDTLKSLFSDLEELREELSNNDLESANDIAEVLRDRLLSFLTHYEKTLADNGIDLPYYGSVSAPQK